MAEEIKKDWWKDKAWISEYLFKGEEPMAHDILGAFICNVAMASPEAILTAGNMPPRLIQFVVNHPKRGRESVMLMLTPMAVFSGEPEEEPDISLEIDYYKFAALLGGEVDVMDMVWSGEVSMSGNTVVGMDLKDVIDACTGKVITERPAAWTIGVP
jgi:hypothetical protein